MKTRTFILLQFPILAISSFNVSLDTWRLNDTKRNKTIDEAIREYFERETYLLSVAIHLEYSLYWELFINQYLTDVLKRTESMSFEILFNHNGHERKKKAFYHNVWYVDSHEAFRALLPGTDNNFLEVMGHYMVVMETAKHLQTEQELQLIFQSAFQRNIVDIAVATYAGNSTFNLYTYDIFQPQQCRQALVRKFNTFRNGHFASNQLFPRKLRNFHKCPIDIFIPTAAPFFYYNLTKDQTEIDYYGGLEATIVRAMAEVLNFEIRLHWGERKITNVHVNGTATGHFRLLKHSEIDILMGYYHNPTRYRFFAVSSSYFLTRLVVVVRKRDKGSFDGMWLMEPFRNSVWLMICLMVALGMTLASSLHYNLKGPGSFNVPVTWLDMFGLALGNTRSYGLRHFGTKYGFTLWTFGFMNICATFGGKLFSAFHSKPVANPISVSQLIKANYTFILKRFVSDDLINALKIPPHLVQFNDYADDDNVLEDMLHDPRKRALLISFWQFQAFVEARHLNGAYDIVPRKVMTNQICAYMRPQSYLVEPFNYLLDTFNSVGIFKKWMMDTARHFGISDDIEVVAKNISLPVPKPLSLDKLRVVFVGLGMLYVLAFAVFVGEIMAKKLSNKRK